MKVYTSYYKKVEDDYNVAPIRISTSAPVWFGRIYKEIPELFPGWDLVSKIKAGEITYEQYVDIYRSTKLAKLDPRQILTMLESLYTRFDRRPLALCCYEKSDEFCHRHLVAEWLNQYEPYLVRERYNSNINKLFYTGFVECNPDAAIPGNLLCSARSLRFNSDMPVDVAVIKDDLLTRCIEFSTT